MRVRVLVLAGILGVCPGILKAEIKVVPKPEVTILINDWNSKVAVGALDGKQEDIRAHGTYELAPGIHTVRVWLHYQTERVEVTGNYPAECTFEALPGTVYRIACEEKTVSTQKGTWRMWLVDQATGKVVPEVHPRPSEADQAAEQAEREANLANTYQEILTKAEAGELEAQYEVGLLTMQGAGVAADPAKATEWYRKAALRGHATAAYLLGLAYDQGDGVPQDAVECYFWHAVASEYGDPAAPYFRDEAAQGLPAEAKSKVDARVAEQLKAVPATPAP